MDDDFTDLRNRRTRTEHHVAELQNDVKREAKARAGMGKKLDDILIRARPTWET